MNICKINKLWQRQIFGGPSYIISRVLITEEFLLFPSLIPSGQSGGDVFYSPLLTLDSVVLVSLYCYIWSLLFSPLYFSLIHSFPDGILTDSKVRLTDTSNTTVNRSTLFVFPHWLLFCFSSRPQSSQAPRNQDFRSSFKIWPSYVQHSKIRRPLLFFIYYHRSNSGDGTEMVRDF